MLNTSINFWFVDTFTWWFIRTFHYWSKVIAIVLIGIFSFLKEILQITAYIKFDQLFNWTCKEGPILFVLFKRVHWPELFKKDLAPSNLLFLYFRGRYRLGFINFCLLFCHHLIVWNCFLILLNFVVINCRWSLILVLNFNCCIYRCSYKVFKTLYFLWHQNHNFIKIFNEFILLFYWVKSKMFIKVHMTIWLVIRRIIIFKNRLNSFSAALFLYRFRPLLTWVVRIVNIRHFKLKINIWIENYN